MNRFKFLLSTLLVVTIIFSCSKDEGINYDQANEHIVRNQQDNSNTLNQEPSTDGRDDSDRLCTEVDLIQFSEDGFFIDDPIKVSAIASAVNVKGVTYPISLLANEVGDPVYTRIVSTPTEDQTGTVYWIPFEKPKESLVTALLPVYERNNSIIVGKITPRFEIIQLDQEDITNEVIDLAKVFTSMEVSIFGLYAPLMHEIALMEKNDKGSQTRECGWIEVSWITVVTTGGVNVDEICPDPSKQIKFKPQGTEIIHHTISVFWCDSWGEAPTDGSEWTNEPNIIGGSGIYDPDGYISDLDFQHAQQKHDFLKQYSPLYSFLDDKFDECENGEFGAEIGPEMIGEVLALQDADLNGMTIEEVKEELEGVYNPQTLFGYVQNAVEKLADMGIELSFTQTIVAINSIAGEYAQLYDALCEQSNEDREILLDDFDNETLINSTESQQTAYVNFIKNYPSLVTDPADKLKLLSDPDFTASLLGFLDNNTNNPNYQYGQLANEIALLCLSYEGDMSTIQLFINAQNLHNLLIESPCIQSNDLGYLLAAPESVDWATNFLNGDCDDDSKAEYTNGVLDILKPDSDFVAMRFSELYELLEANINLFTECDDSPTNLEDWSELASFVPPQNILDIIEDMGEGWRLQDFLTPTAAPSLNLDYFSVTISDLPLNPETGIKFEANEFFDFFRKNINSFVDTQASEFNPIEEQLWLSDNPLGAIISIDIEGPDNGSVICSQYEECCWIFSTVKAPFLPDYDGYHPVSGNRQFGYNLNANGQMELYTRGTDRFFSPESPPFTSAKGYGDLLGYILEKVAFPAADGLWISMQEGVKSFVVSNGGTSEINEPQIRRPNKDNLLDLLRQDFPINSVSCQN